MRRTIDRTGLAAQGVAMRRLVYFGFAAVLLWPVGSSAEPVPHRAEYILRLGPAANAPRIGTAVSDLSADCAGWRLKRDIAAEIGLTAAWKIAVGSKLDGEEARGGGAFRYRATQIQNGSERQTHGRLQRTAKEVRGEIVSSNSPAQITLPAATLMPVAGIAHLIERLRNGAGSFPALMFDAEVISDAMLIDVELLERGMLRAARPGDKPVAMPEGKSWPVSMTFTNGRNQAQRPLFTVTALVWETGILDRLTVDTGLINVTADIQSLDLRKAPHCPRS